MTEFHEAIFCLVTMFIHDRPSVTLVAYHLERGDMPLQGAVGVKCEKGTTTEIKTPVPSIWAKGCVG